MSNIAFAMLAPQPADALLGLIQLYRADARTDKIDLGVGVFRNDAGETPVMRAVKLAEADLLRDQQSKSYLGAEGDVRYCELLGRVAFGEKLAGDPLLGGVQTPGGTGALRLGAELIARNNSETTIWIGTPTWPNHGPIFNAAGLRTRFHRFYDTSTSALDFDGMMEDLAAARSGDILLLHGSCHNPTGASFTPAQWQTIANLCLERELTPFVDIAYQGLGDTLQRDTTSARLLLEQLPAALVAYSCNKIFGLYRERVGALWVKGETADIAVRIRANMLALARSLWSMPPDHGAAIVRVILESDDLRLAWEAELEAMRNRINGLRRQLASSCPALGFTAEQRGMFAMLPVTPDAVNALRTDHGIYMAGSGRINIAGLTSANLPTFVDKVGPFLG